MLRAAARARARAGARCAEPRARVRGHVVSPHRVHFRELVQRRHEQLPRRCAPRSCRTRERRGGLATASPRPVSWSTARTSSPGPRRASPRSPRRRRRRNPGHTSPGRTCNRCVTASQKRSDASLAQTQCFVSFPRLTSSLPRLTSSLFEPGIPGAGFRRARARARHGRGGVRRRGAFGSRGRLRPRPRAVAAAVAAARAIAPTRRASRPTSKPGGRRPGTSWHWRTTWRTPRGRRLPRKTKTRPFLLLRRKTAGRREEARKKKRAPVSNRPRRTKRTPRLTRVRRTNRAGTRARRRFLCASPRSAVGARRRRRSTTRTPPSTPRVTSSLSSSTFEWARHEDAARLGRRERAAPPTRRTARRWHRLSSSPGTGRRCEARGRSRAMPPSRRGRR